MLTFAQLTTPMTSSESEAQIIQRLSELGFSSKGWQSGDPQLTLVKLLSWLFSRYTFFVSDTAKGGFNDTSEGDLLTKFSKSQFDHERKETVAYQYNVRHTVAVGEGPHTVNIGDLVATNGVSTYRSLTAATLTSAGAVDITYEAEIPGPGSAAGDDTITTLVTPLAGVTVTNPGPSTIRAGASGESDPSIRIRNSSRWATLAIDMPADGYENVSLGIDGVARVQVDDTNPRGPGTVDVYVAAAGGPVDGATLIEVQTALDGRRSVVADVLAIDPTPSTVVVEGLVYMDPAYATSGGPLIRKAAEDYINTLPIGGEEIDGIVKGVTEDGLKAAIRAVRGVKNVNLTSPLSDVSIAAFTLAIADATGLTAVAL